MFTISAVSQRTTASRTVARVAKRSTTERRGAAIVRRAESTEDATPSVSSAVEEANAEWKASNEAANVVEMKKDAIDPADGSIAEAAPLGNDNSLLDSVMVAFKDSRAVEMINGRAAMVGWMLALNAELANNHVSLAHQIFNTRTFTLADGVVRTSTYPASGFFLVPVVVLVALAASLAPALKKSSPNGLNEEPEAFGPFNPKAELTNGRASMVGLVSLWAAEHFTNGAALFGF